MRVFSFQSVPLLALAIGQAAAAQCSHTGMVPVPRHVIVSGSQTCPGLTHRFFGAALTLPGCPEWVIEIPAHDGFGHRFGFDAVITHAIPVMGIRCDCVPVRLSILDLGARCVPRAPVVFGAVFNFANVPCGIGGVPLPPVD
ncbi:MAG: hypothetical protein IPK26_16735 [Planctomycetes bacterium]|nr:hypothetical protein [Planctomycetota bacterium]